MIAVRWWVSWWHKPSMGDFELHSPWWVSGFDEGGSESVCAAIIADSERSARRMILAAYDKKPRSIEFRFCNARPGDWNPFCGRFPRADWMQWPEEVKQ